MNKIISIRYIDNTDTKTFTFIITRRNGVSHTYTDVYRGRKLVRLASVISQMKEAGKIIVPLDVEGSVVLGDWTLHIIY